MVHNLSLRAPRLYPVLKAFSAFGCSDSAFLLRLEFHWPDCSGRAGLSVWTLPGLHNQQYVSISVRETVRQPEKITFFALTKRRQPEHFCPGCHCGLCDANRWCLSISDRLPLFQCWSEFASLLGFHAEQQTHHSDLWFDEKHLLKTGLDPAAQGLIAGTAERLAAGWFDFAFLRSHSFVMLDPFSRKTLVNLIAGAVLFAVLMLVDWIVRSLFGR